MKIYFETGKNAVLKAKPLYMEYFGRSNIADDEFYFFVETNNEIIGVVRLTIENSIYLLRSMLIIPKFREKGVGNLLLNEFECYLINNEIKKVYCLPWAYLENYYSTIGFKRTSIENVPNFLLDRLKLYNEEQADEVILMVRG